jgi:Ni,Fe-hydrogenase III small subunit
MSPEYELAVRQREDLWADLLFDVDGEVEPDKDGGERDLPRAAEKLRERMLQVFGRSLHVRHVDAGSCNACESETKMLTNPYYDVQRLGIFFTPSPRHADLLLITGPLSRAMQEPLRLTYEAMPDPRLVLAVGACACSGGLFCSSPLAGRGLAEALPVDAYVPGCPPSPLALIHGLLLALGKVQQKQWHSSRAMSVGDEARRGSESVEVGS